jgi:hypothetical protein
VTARPPAYASAGWIRNLLARLCAEGTSDCSDSPVEVARLRIAMSYFCRLWLVAGVGLL